MRRALLCFVMAALTGCEEEGAVNCTDDLRYAIDGEVVDETGAPLDPDTLVYSVNGGDDEQLDCEESDCSSFAVGPEQPGEYSITATFCGISQTEVVSVGADECHVVVTPVTLQIDTTACTE